MIFFSEQNGKNMSGPVNNGIQYIKYYARCAKIEQTGTFLGAKKTRGSRRKAKFVREKYTFQTFLFVLQNNEVGRLGRE